jgi:putative ABC transport system ATP-binding protein
MAPAAELLPAAPLITVEHLDHSFQEAGLAKQVLHDINLQVHPGEVVILTGPSGSGKTTLLTMLGGLRAAQCGSLRILGAELLHAEPSTLTRLRRQVGFIFQAHNLLPYLTALENVRLGLEVHPHWLEHGRGAMDQCAAAMLEQVGLTERAHYYPEKLSGGQKQRVAIARALAPAPQLLLADEPTAALDRDSGRAAVELFRQLADQQRAAIVMVTHDNKVLDIADRIVNLEEGRLVSS